VSSRTGELQFDHLLTLLRTQLEQLPDRRVGKNIHYSMADIALSAFSVFFTQSPSFLDFQRQMGRVKGQHNAASIFGVREIPTDNQIRSVLDAVEAERLYGIFDQVLEEVRKAGGIEEFRSLGGDVLVTLDGTEYYRSEKHFCAQCHRVKQRNGKVGYKHLVLTSALVKPGKGEVLVLAPEFIRAEDGGKKAENEITASKRWVERMAEKLRPLSVTLVGDDLYAAHPFLSLVREKGLNFLCVCKPDSHPYLYESVESFRKGGELERYTERVGYGKKERIREYEWVEEVPIRDSEDALRVGWVGVTEKNAAGEVVYKNAFITNHPLSAQRVREVVEAGRARWKVENEDINTLKTKGYHLEHNFGHGKQHLCETLATLNMLAFLLHTLLDLYDARYRVLRADRGRRHRFFQELGTLLCYWYFDSWTEVLVFMLTQLHLEDPGG